MNVQEARQAASEGFDFRVSTGAYIPYTNAPAAMGVSLPEGGVTDVGSVQAVDPSGAPYPVQATPLAQWPDGSVKWALIELPSDVPAALPPHIVQTYRVRFSDQKPQQLGDVRCEETADGIVLSNSRLSLRFDRGRFAVISEAMLDGRPIVRDSDASDIIIRDGQGKRYYASKAKDYKLELEHCGPVRATVRLSGKHTAPDGETFLDFRLRISMFHACPDVLIEHQFTNREDAMPGVKVRGLKLVQNFNVGDDPVCAVTQGSHGADTVNRPLGGIRQNMSIQTGTPLCTSMGYPGPIVTDPRPFKEDFSKMDFHIRSYPGVIYSSGPWLDVSGQSEGRVQGVTTFFRHMLENRPKIVENKGGQVVLHVVPRMPEDLHYMQGWSKRHEIGLCFHHGSEEGDPAERDRTWYRMQNRPTVTIPFEWYKGTGVEDMDKIMPPKYRKYPILETKFYWVSGRDEGRGMLHWGDNYGGAAREGWAPGASGNNNEEDSIYGHALLGLRNSDPRRFDFVWMATRHQTDIDTISYSQDPLRNGAHVPHAVDHVRGATYPSHMWITGMVMYYYLTGDPDARAAAIAQAEVNLRFIESRWEATTMTGREHGWPILNLTTVYGLTRDPKYLAGAKKLIDDVERRMNEYGGVYYPHHPYGFSQFANYSVYEGMYKYWKHTGDAEMKELFLRVVDWLIETDFGERGFSYCRNGQWFANLFPLAMAYDMTGDEKYAEAGKVGTILMMTYHPILDWSLRELLHFLQLAGERGWIQECQPQNAEF